MPGELLDIPLGRRRYSPSSKKGKEITSTQVFSGEEKKRCSLWMGLTFSEGLVPESGGVRKFASQL